MRAANGFPGKSGNIRLGARWDDSMQNGRFLAAKAEGLLDYVEVNFPVSPSENPADLGLPILAHTSNNPLCSVHGIDNAIASRVKAGADQADSPWIGEHLAWLGFAKTGALGYVINPPFCRDFAEVACANIESLKRYYGRPIALELGPVYNYAGDYSSELHFLSQVATRTGCGIIWDITHWMITNRNLRRGEGFGLTDIDAANVVELHVAGMRQGASSHHWHDAHGMAPTEDIFEMVKKVLKVCKNVRAVTLEHSMEGKEPDFQASLRRLRDICK